MSGRLFLPRGKVVLRNFCNQAFTLKTSLPMSDGNGMGLQHQWNPLDSAEVIVH
jgi:hypothetical protein